MPRLLLLVPMLAAAMVGAWLARAAVVRWRDLKAAQTYELATEQRPLLLRAGGAVLCGICVTALTVALALEGRSGTQEARAVAAPRPAVPPSVGVARELPPVV